MCHRELQHPIRRLEYGARLIGRGLARAPVAQPPVAYAERELPSACQQVRPRPPRTPQETRPRIDPRINRENAGVMLDFCKGAGAGTPQCRSLGLGGRRNRR